jgi:hypothetical protein
MKNGGKLPGDQENELTLVDVRRYKQFAKVALST